MSSETKNDLLVSFGQAVVSERWISMRLVSNDASHGGAMEYYEGHLEFRVIQL